MKKIIHLYSLLTILVLPASVSAAGLATDGTGGDFGTLLQSILNLTNTVIIPFIIAIGFLVFVWGMFQYFIAGGANDDAKEKGKSLMIYATLGFVLIVIFWGIVNLLTASTGLEDGADTFVAPKVTVPS